MGAHSGPLGLAARQADDLAAVRRPGQPRAQVPGWRDGLERQRGRRLADPGRLADHAGSIVAVRGRHRPRPVLCGRRMPPAVGTQGNQDMKAPRPRWPLLAAATAMVLLAACSVVSRAAYPYRPAGPTRPRPRASEAERPVPLPRPRASEAERPVPRPPRSASYWGVYEPGTPASYRPIQQFTALMGGAAPRIVLYFSSWGQPFEAAYALAAHDHGALTLVQIQPADVSMAGIAARQYDGYCRSC